MNTPKATACAQQINNKLFGVLVAPGKAVSQMAAIIDYYYPSSADPAAKCIIDPFSSRTCQLGTKSCTVQHDVMLTPTEELAFCTFPGTGTSWSKLMSIAKRHATELEQARADLAAERLAQEKMAVRLTSQERVDNSPCQAHILDWLEQEIVYERSLHAPAKASAPSPIEFGRWHPVSSLKDGKLPTEIKAALLCNNIAHAAYAIQINQPKTGWNPIINWKFYLPVEDLPPAPAACPRCGSVDKEHVCLPVDEIAEKLARTAHAGQTRRDGKTPYITHVEAVVKRLAGESAEVRAAGWLHDVLEDTETNVNELLAAGIPAAVVLDVEALTHTTVEAYAKYIARVVKKESTRKVKRADILANLSDNPTEAQVMKYAKALLMITSAPGVKLT